VSDAAERALLDAIVANPDDDEPRLVYADMLESRGDPRGELIQLQCRLARAPDPELQARVDELLQHHSRALLADLLALRLGATFEFARGFVRTMAAQFPAATVHAAALLERAPLLEVLALTVHGQLDRMQLARPDSDVVLARASSLAIRGRHRGNTRDARGPIADFGGLAEVPFTRLRTLRLERLRPRIPTLCTLVSSPHLGVLEVVELSLRMPATETARVTAAIELPALRVLDLRGNQIPPGAVEHLRERRPDVQVITA